MKNGGEKFKEVRLIFLRETDLVHRAKSFTPLLRVIDTSAFESLALIEEVKTASIFELQLVAKSTINTSAKLIKDVEVTFTTLLTNEITKTLSSKMPSR